MLFRTPGECKGPHRTLLRPELMQSVIDDIHMELIFKISGEQVGLLRKVRHPLSFCKCPAQWLFTDDALERCPLLFRIRNLFHNSEAGVICGLDRNVIAVVAHLLYRGVEHRLSQSILFGILCKLFCTTPVIYCRQLDVSYLGHGDSEELGNKSRAYISDSQRYFSIPSQIIMRVSEMLLL